jgi:8-oxo-dGTP pyrophosphatase MutT (NUDIX family)
MLLDTLAGAAPTEEGQLGTLVDLHHMGLDPSWLDEQINWLELRLGLIHRHDHLRVEVVSFLAGYALRILSDIIDADPTLLAYSLRTDSLLNPPTGSPPLIAFLTALESRRIALLANPAPVREVRAAVGLIERHEPPNTHLYLLMYDIAAHAWQLPGGRHECRDGSLRSTLLRELSEELGCAPIHEPSDVELVELHRPLVSHRRSPTFGLLTRTTFHVFQVRLLRPVFMATDLRWISTEEILAQKTVDHQKVSAGPLQHFLRAAHTAQAVAL